jgi:hypothetical protein
MIGDDVPVGGEIPDRVRKAVHARDNLYCRMCGANCELGGIEIHHIYFGGDTVGIGGSRVHDFNLMVSLCMTCHTRAHRFKFKWQKALMYAVSHRGVTAAQVLRWSKRSQINRRSKTSDAT